MTTKLPEPEPLALLRHRWARTIEMWVAYRTFLHREVLVGPDRICLDDRIVWQTTHTLLACYYSFVYSLFDPSGVHFEFITQGLTPHLPPPATDVRAAILRRWETMKQPVAVIRNNIGFHGAPKKKGKDTGYSAYGRLHPSSSEHLMTLMRVFFRLVDEVYEGGHRRMRPTHPGEIQTLLAMADDIERQIEATPMEDQFQQLWRSWTRSANGESEQS